MLFYQGLIFTFCNIIIKCVASNASHLEVIACYENTTYFETVANKPRVVDVRSESIVHLWCHYCDDGKEDYFPKLWYYKPRGNKKQKDLLTVIANNDFNTKILITPIHMLTINDFNVNDSGIYTCKSPEIIKKENDFVYILEGVIDVDIHPKVGPSIQWQEYKRNYFDTLNRKFKTSKEEPYKSVRTDFNITLKLVTIWENWGECKEIDHQKGVRKRLGRCRLQPSVINGSHEVKPRNIHPNTATTTFLTDGYDISCRSTQLKKTLPKISDIIKNIPDFEAEEICNVINKTAKYAINKDKIRKHKTQKKVEENSHVTLSCAEANSNSDLKWFKEAKLLNSLFRNNIIICKNEEEPHISVDTNNSLHILHISKNEEGNYSCLSNGKKIQEFEVTVVSKSKLLNQEFIRYSIYLGFVLSLAMTCYCAGVCVAWHRRSSFVDPLNMNNRGVNEYYRLQCERERLLK